MTRTQDSRVWLLLCFPSRGGSRGGAAPLGTAEWRQLARSLRGAGLTHPGELLEVRPSFWSTAGLAEAEVDRVRALLDRGALLDEELERLEDLGIQVLTPADAAYPARLKQRLRGMAPPVLFGAGDYRLAERPALAMAGSRDVDPEGAAFCSAVAARAARDGLAVITGGAKGVDQLAMLAALEAGGVVTGVAAGDLERSVRSEEARQWIANLRLLLLSPFHPGMGFTAGNAMSRNKIVYALADYGLVVSSAHGHGGTWAGATEVRRHGWVPLFVRDGVSVPDGNRELLRPAAIPFPSLELIGDEPLSVWLARKSSARHGEPRAAEPDHGVPDSGEDLYPRVWPRIAAYLRTPHSLAEIAKSFHLCPQQAVAWVRRAEAEGEVLLASKQPRRYRAVLDPPLQGRLFESRAEYGHGCCSISSPTLWPDAELLA